MPNFRKMNLLRAGALLPAALLVGGATRTEPAPSPRIVDSYGKLPLSFEANHGQTDPRVKFLSRGRGYTLFLTGDAAAVLSLHGEESNAVLRMNLRGANAHARVAGTDPLPGKSNYFIGRDPSQWRTNVPTYGAVKYTGVYPGIDLVYHGNQRLLEYDFVVAPGADPRVIDIRFQGAQKLTVNGEGALVIGIGGNEVIEHAPVVYQEIAGQRQTLDGRYVLRGKGHVGLEVDEYDRTRALVIDPVLVYSTYLGGSGDDPASGIAVDGSGNAYITGSTNSSDFPNAVVFITKLNAAGTALVYSTYLGGGQAYAHGIAVDRSGNAYVTGEAWSGFPTTPGAFQTDFGNSLEKAFVSKLNATGSALVYSTYLGGSMYSVAYNVAIDASGNAYVAGETDDPGFPTTPAAFQATIPSSYCTFVSKLNASGSALLYSTFLGGGDLSYSGGIVVDASGNAYVTGGTTSSDFPTTPGAFQTTLPGWEAAFVSKLNANGSALLYSTYLGGSFSLGRAIAVDISGNAYVTGQAQSNFPITPGALQPIYDEGPGPYPAYYGFVSKLDAIGSSLLYSTYLFGKDEVPYSIAVDGFGNAYVAGSTSSSDFPTTAGAVQSTFGGGQSDAFVLTLNVTGSALLYSTYLGGSGLEGSRLALDASGNLYVAGPTNSPNFPTTPGAFQLTFGGGSYDAFVSKLNLGPFLSGPVTTAYLNGPSGNDHWYLRAVTVTLAATAGSSPVSATYYSLDNGPYQGYGAPFPISTDGIHQLLYYSVDTAGNQETPHGQTIKIDTVKPVSRVAALPTAAASPNFSVQWSGTDATSGLANFTIYVSDNGGSFAPWLSNVTTTQAWYSGSLLHTYGFYSIATDVAGNAENAKTAADATTHVPQMPGDINADGRIECTDIGLVKASLGKRAGQTGFNPRADLNGDGVVDIRDLATVSQKLAPGTKCP